MFVFIFCRLQSLVRWGTGRGAVAPGLSVVTGLLEVGAGFSVTGGTLPFV